MFKGWNILNNVIIQSVVLMLLLSKNDTIDIRPAPV